MLLTRLPICRTQSLRVKVLEGVMSCIYYDPTATIAVLNTSTFLLILVILKKKNSLLFFLINLFCNIFIYSFTHSFIYFYLFY